MTKSKQSKGIFVWERKRPMLLIIQQSETYTCLGMAALPAPPTYVLIVADSSGAAGGIGGMYDEDERLGDDNDDDDEDCGG